MSKEQKLFYLATTTSNACGIDSKLAGYECTKWQSDEGGNFNQTSEGYANNICVYADLLTESDLDEAPYNLTEDEMDEATELVDGLRGYDEQILRQIALDDWKEQEGEATA